MMMSNTLFTVTDVVNAANINTTSNNANTIINNKKLKQNTLSFFAGFNSKVSNEVHDLNMKIHIINTKDKMAKELKEKLISAELKEADLKERAKQARADRIELLKQAQELKEVDDANREIAEEVLEIEEIEDIYKNIEDVTDDLTMRNHKSKPKIKEWNKRPDCWCDIADHHAKFADHHAK